MWPLVFKGAHSLLPGSSMVFKGHVAFCHGIVQSVVLRGTQPTAMGLCGLWFLRETQQFQQRAFLITCSDRSSTSTSLSP